MDYERTYGHEADVISRSVLEIGGNVADQAVELLRSLRITIPHVLKHRHRRLVEDDATRLSSDGILREWVSTGGPSKSSDLRTGVGSRR